MNQYRVTIRYGRPHRYHLEDVEAPTLRDALRLAVDGFPSEIEASSDLLEIRKQADPHNA
jgi:hypothetical protein